VKQKWKTQVAAKAATATGKCTRRLAPIAGRNAKFRSNRRQEGRCTAGTATKTTGNPEAAVVAADAADTKGKSYFFFGR